MTPGNEVIHDLSPRRIIGFACNQAFIFFALFVGLNASGSFVAGGFVVDRLSLASLLLFMVLGFAVVRVLGPLRVPTVFSRPLLYIYAVIAAIGMLLPALLPEAGSAADLVRGAFMGLASALLLTAWGRAFGCVDAEISVLEVFLGSIAGTLVCLLFSLGADMPVMLGAVCLLPLAGVVNIQVGESQEGRKTQLGVVESRSGGTESARILSAKILAGTLLFGTAAGLVLLHHGAVGPLAQLHSRVGMILFAAFLIGALTLLLSDGFGRGAALNKSYRLAVFVMVVGVLMAAWPLLNGSALSGDAVVLAGFMGLEAVLISLFLTIAEITGHDCAMSFSSGFLALFAGELLGTMCDSAIFALVPADSAPYLVVVLAGSITLLGYIFLFTERDFDELSQLVDESDSLERSQVRIVERYGLSNREAEILAFALHGRTSERIAQELYISKSTVDTHLRRIYAKCGIHSRQELIDLAEELAKA